MELSDANLQTLTEYLKKTLDPDPAIRRPAEKFLESVEGSQNYPLLLLTLLEKSQENVIKVCASVTFKNYIKRNWRIVGILVEDEPNKICESDRIAIKANIVPLMLSSPEQIQKQLSDAISIIGREDFPQKWPDLLTEMVNRFQSGDFHVINGVLRTAHSLFKRYRHEFKSNELWTEIKLVLDAFALPLTNLFKATIELCSTHANDASALKVLFSSLILIAKLFYSLNFQDLPEFFEDNMETWMTNFHSLLTLDNKLLQTDDEEEAGLLELLKSQICDNAALYAQKYDEEFQPYLPRFVTAIWNLLVTTGQEVKYDLLVSNAIQFLASVCERPHYKHLFEDQNTLTSICEKVIVPNMEFRAADEEAFEDNSEEYIRRDLEGSDIDTRRRAACDLVRGLCKFFEGPVTGIFSGYVNSMLQEYAKNPSVNWKHKDAAIYLVTSLASKAQTQKHGITQANELVNLTEFFVNHIQPDLKSASVNEFPVLKADGIKYIMIFRNQVPKEQLLVSIPLLINHLQAESIVVHTYAAHALERLFTMRGTNNTTLITAAEMAPFVEVLLTNLFKALTLPGSSENEYIMKAIMRSFSLLQESIIPYIPSVITQLTQKLLAVSKNPSKPHFNHYMFESICLSIRITCKANPDAVGSFEEALFMVFTEILQNDVQEFIPYVFQVMSLLLEMHKNEIPSSYMALFPHLLQPVLWERTGNIPPLVRLLQAYLERGANTIASAAADKIPGLLGVFQKLIASKANDHQGFYLLNSIIEHMPPGSVDQYRKQIFILLFQRLQNSKTTKFIKSFLVFINLYCIKYGALALQEIFDSIQPKMFGMVLEKIIIPEIQKVSGQVEKKICAVGITKILTECPPMMDTEYTKLWTPLLQALIGLFELPEDDTIPDEEHFIDIEDTPGYQTAFSQLAFAGKKEHDPVGQMVNNPRIHLAQSLHKLSTACPGRVPSMLSTSLNAEALQYLQGYLQAASVTLL
ncbi:Exportin-2 [Apaloderma vittatum]|nr:Exportin-2 [Apaloderma vittatum]